MNRGASVSSATRKSRRLQEWVMSEARLASNSKDTTVDSPRPRQRGSDLRAVLRAGGANPNRLTRQLDLLGGFGGAGGRAY